MARLMDTLLIALSSLATACSLFPTRQTACSQDRACPSGQYCRPDTATCETSPAVEDMALPEDLATLPDLATPPGMIFVPGGQFTMGDDVNGAAEEKPAHIQVVSSFFLDITKVTVADYALCVTSTACSAAGTGGTCNHGIAMRETHPINCVSWSQADAYCQWKSKRLPTEIEFEYVVRGSSGAMYAWGNDNPSNQLCWKKTTTCPVMMYSPTLFGIQDSNGARDLAGNLVEWMGNPRCDYPITATGGVNCLGTGSVRPIRGSRYDDSDELLLRGFERRTADPSNATSVYGFRCAQNP